MYMYMHMYIRRYALCIMCSPVAQAHGTPTAAGMMAPSRNVVTWPSKQRVQKCSFHYGASVFLRAIQNVAKILDTALNFAN